MTKKKNIKQKIIKREFVHNIDASEIRGLSKNKADGIMAIMAAVLVILTSMLDYKSAVIIAAILMILYAAYKLIRK